MQSSHRHHGVRTPGTPFKIPYSVAADLDHDSADLSPATQLLSCLITTLLCRPRPVLCPSPASSLAQPHTSTFSLKLASLSCSHSELSSLTSRLRYLLSVLWRSLPSTTLTHVSDSAFLTSSSPGYLGRAYFIQPFNAHALPPL